MHAALLNANTSLNEHDPERAAEKIRVLRLLHGTAVHHIERWLRDFGNALDRDLMGEFKRLTP